MLEVYQDYEGDFHFNFDSCSLVEIRDLMTLSNEIKVEEEKTTLKRGENKI